MLSRKKVKMDTFGCQMNKSDSEKILGLLSTIGYEPTELEEDADLIVVNTCSIRENAVQRLMGHLGNYKKLKRFNPNLIISVGGCVPQHEKENIRKKVPFVDIVFGSQNFNKIHELVQNFEENRRPFTSVIDKGNIFEEDMPTYRDEKFHAWITVMNGCSRYCTYCIVPYVRGNEISRQPESIVREIEIAVEKGCKEITLLGQIVDLYGRDLKPKVSFEDLLYKVHEIKGLERIRFVTSHPKFMSKSIVDTVAELDKICEYFHIPLQAGNNDILKKMNRRYTVEDYEEVINYIRAKIPDATISSDFIVGFPTETEEQFMDTVNSVIKFGFDSANTAAYSIRPGTVAGAMEGQIDEETKNIRINALNKVVKEVSKRKNQERIGKVENILVVGHNEKRNNFFGRTRGARLVHFQGDHSLIGQFVDVKITDATSSSLRGELIDSLTLKV